MSRVDVSHLLRRTRRYLATAAGIRLRAILSLGIVLGLGATGTLASWANSTTATSGVLSTGTVDLRVNSVKTFSFTDLALSGMLPGESRAAVLQVQNTQSTMDVRYTMSAATPAGSPALASLLQVRVHSGGTPTNSTTGGLRTGNCAGGSPISSGFLTPGGSTPLISGQRPLAARVGVETLCFIATLTSDAPFSVQNQNLSTITLNFDARTTV
ncbi:SipW-dependent-type signal peptide-containing protein [Rhodococcus rhodochrous]|uniref:SipW-dependent-type signal peptide-containing protein n=1 Tax=Rhodococcus rhodochrous TaxID=1829 RepID=UPI000E64B931|nr:SipW-dependent-type signal peptide-containing protein [Rhodococcus rhodochrous]MCR8691516.1 SipW-dependent-type signal peptide-containing protein [Rhodococcus pyridinivorans]AYA23741.1 hypothetical protein C6369_003870 [Rhodococcus rhodochrous]MCD2099253.1 SipW-dependent-type signal peptide-containing protein [Rhodococcus rhodochrous]MCD2120568.1 SipW-dependent-type signal peptide-containing protein [Rhodococcus rhodochrous]MCQ4136144.1 SipW-dependent-type signal peptide-containing protein 